MEDCHSNISSSITSDDSTGTSRSPLLNDEVASRTNNIPVLAGDDYNKVQEAGNSLYRNSDSAAYLAEIQRQMALINAYKMNCYNLSSNNLNTNPNKLLVQPQAPLQYPTNNSYLNIQQQSQLSNLDYPVYKRLHVDNPYINRPVPINQSSYNFSQAQNPYNNLSLNQNLSFYNNNPQLQCGLPGDPQNQQSTLYGQQNPPNFNLQQFHNTFITLSSQSPSLISTILKENYVKNQNRSPNLYF